MPKTANHPKNTSKKVGIWIRVSTVEQAKGESPEHHEKRARYYAEAKEWEVVSVYHLEAVSGKSVMAHPETQRMLADIRAGAISSLIFSKLARLARNTKELLEFSDIFQEHGAGLISLQEAIDTTTPAGRLFYTVIAAMAQWEREEIAERVAASVPIRAKLGKNLGGQAIFGYRWKNNVLEPDPEESPVRALVYELYKEHRRKKTVARLLNEKGYRTRKGAKFSDTTVERLLRDPTAKGQRRANYTKSTGLDKSWALKPESEWVWLSVEPIVSDELWDQCNSILDQQKASRKKVTRKVVHLFAGITQCSCGAKMYKPSNTPKYVCYECRNKIPVVDLNGIFHEQLKTISLHPKELDEYFENANKTLQAKEELVRTLKLKQHRLEKEIDKVYELYMSDQIPTEGFGKRIAPFEEQLKQIEIELPEAQAERDVLKISYLSRDQIVTNAKELYDQWPQLSHDEKRIIVEAVTDSIIIGEDEVSFNLCYFPRETMASGQCNIRDS